MAFLHCCWIRTKEMGTVLATPYKASCIEHVIYSYKIRKIATFILYLLTILVHSVFVCLHLIFYIPWLTAFWAAAACKALALTCTGVPFGPMTVTVPPKNSQSNYSPRPEKSFNLCNLVQCKVLVSNVGIIKWKCR